MKLLIIERKIDVLCISETWLQTNTPNGYVEIPNYTIYRCDNGRGAGVCMYVHSTLKSSVINLDVPRPKGVEDVWVKIQSRKWPAIIIGCVYRHPKALVTSFDYIEEVFRIICLREKSVFILGDFNDDMMTQGNKISKLIKNNKLTQIIDKPTRTTSTSATLLDLIITNKPDVILSQDVVPQVIADHDLISAVLNIRKPRKLPMEKTFRKLKNYDKDTFCSLLLNNVHHMKNIFLTDNVNKQVDIFNDVFINCLNMCAPLVTKAVKGKPTPWMNDDIREAMKHRDNLQSELKIDTTNSQLRERYKIAKKQVKQLINKTRTDHYHKRLKDSKGNTSGTWNIIKEIIPSQKNKHNAYNFENLSEKAKEFNNFFATVGESTFKRSQKELFNEGKSIAQPPQLNINIVSAFRPQPVDTNTIILTVKDLNATSSVGSDGIKLRFLTDALGVIVPFLTCIVNTSLVTGVFPEIWKHALVVPIHKNGDSDCVNNYRPISILPIISKVLEKIVAKQLSCYLESNNLLSKSQHGFRPKLSTETALTTLTDRLYENMDNKKISLLTLCDLSKAFDTVNHKILLYKCSLLNIDYFWFDNYLKDRSMSVRLENNISRKKNISYGVPQGSILGPILFGIYVNDLHAHVDCFLTQYADDTQFLHSGTVEDLNQIIKDTENTHDKCRDYFLKNGLMCNSSKTQCIFIGNRQLLSKIPPNTTINFNGNIIHPCNHVKTLGVYIDRYMLFDVHINELNKKAIGILMYISRIGDKLDKHTRIIVVQTLVLNIIEYCIRIWGSTSDTLISSAQKLQNFAARVAVGGVKKYDHVSPCFEELKWLRLKQKHVFDVGVTIFKVLRGFYPEWFLAFSTRQAVTSSITRQRHSLYVTRSKTHSGDRRTAVLGVKLWNALSTFLTHAPSLNTFKARLKEFLLTSNV